MITTLEYFHIKKDSEVKLGNNGDRGDILHHLVIIPRSKSPGDVILFDGNESIVLFDGGLHNLSDTMPKQLQLIMKSKNGGFKIVCGVNVECIAMGLFS